MFHILVVSTVLVIALALGLLLNRLLHHWAARSPETWRGLEFAILEPLPLPLLLLAALHISLETLTLPRQYERLGSKLVIAVVILVIFYFPGKVLGLFLRRMARKDPTLERATQPAAFIVRALFALLAVIIVLENLGISLTAVWTTLGVGSVAVALALQETLSNFFAGLYLLADRPVNPGDYIKLDSGQEGFVVRVGWRSTTLRTLPNNLVVVPNATLAKATLTNYSLPEPRMGLVMPISVAYGTDPALVERALLEVARDAIRDGVEGLVAEPAPLVRFIPGFGTSSLDFSLIVQVRQFTDQYPVQSELRKRIVKRFEEESIRIPFTTYSILMEEAPRKANPGEQPGR